MIRQLFNRIRKVFKSDREAPVKSDDTQTRARVKGALMASALAQPTMKKSRRLKAGKMRLYKSYHSATPAI